MTQANSNDTIQKTPVSLNEVSESVSPIETLPLAKEGESLPFRQEETRSQLAKYLIYGWAITILLVLGLIAGDKIAYYHLSKEERAEIKDPTGNKDLITLVLTTQSTLVGAALGFYFGRNSN